jgi:hypothetical protein
LAPPFPKVEKIETIFNVFISIKYIKSLFIMASYYEFIGKYNYSYIYNCYDYKPIYNYYDYERIYNWYDKKPIDKKPIDMSHLSNKSTQTQTSELDNVRGVINDKKSRILGFIEDPLLVELTDQDDIEAKRAKMEAELNTGDCDDIIIR